MKEYIPSKGDFIALTFDPQSGHEQKGRRPALVISNTLFNQKTGLAIVCPITNKDRSYPFHIKISGSGSLTGSVMVEQVKSVDYNSRRVKFIDKAPHELLNEVLIFIKTNPITAKRINRKILPITALLFFSSGLIIF